MNVASVDTAPVSLNVPALAASSLIAQSSLAPVNELGAFLALFTGFVGKNESTLLSRSADQQPTKEPDREKDNSAAKNPVTIAITSAPVPDLPQVLVEPSVSHSLPIGGQAGQAVARDTFNPTPVYIASSPLLEPRIAFALQLTPVVTASAPTTPRNASVSVEPKQSSEIVIEPKPSPNVESEPAQPVQQETGRMAGHLPAPSVSQAANRQEPIRAANEPEDNRVTAQQSPKEFIAIPVAKSTQPVHDTPQSGSGVQPARPLVSAGNPDSPASSRDERQAEPLRSMPAPEGNDVHQPRGPQLPADHSAYMETQPVQEGQPEQTGTRPPSSPVSERVVSPRVQQQATQQRAGNGQSGSRESKAQTQDHKDESPDRTQSRIQKNPIAFEPRAQAAAETNTTAIASGRPATNSREATIIAPEIETKATAQPQPARQLSLKLAGPDSKQVDVQLMERAGRVQVSVRTADRQLAKSLQGDLGDLVGRLENKGYKTEVWAPVSRHMAAVLEPANTANGHGQPEHYGSGTGQQQERQGRNGSNQRQQPRWAAQFEETLSAEETRKENE